MLLQLMMMMMMTTQLAFEMTSFDLVYIRLSCVQYVFYVD